MRRFLKGRAGTAGFSPRPLLLPAAALALFFMGTGALFQTNEAERLQAVEQSVRRAAVHCYAVEGVYPPSLDYLESRYGLSVDHGRYVVDYRCFASNLPPDITVLAK